MSPERRELLILGGVAAAAAFAGVLIGPLALQSQSGAADLLSASFPDLDGRPRRFLDWQGQVLVANFWATWCAPCREEVPLLVTAHQRFARHGAEIVGVGIDVPEKLRRFADEYRIGYPVLVADAAAIELMRRLGNSAGALPFTVILDQRGALAHRRLGLLREEELEGVLRKLLR